MKSGNELIFGGPTTSRYNMPDQSRYSCDNEAQSKEVLFLGIANHRESRMNINVQRSWYLP